MPPFFFGFLVLYFMKITFERGVYYGEESKGKECI